MDTSPFEFDLSKSALLRKTRGIGFEEIVVLIEEGRLLAVLSHPNSDRHPQQEIYLVDVNGYVWVVPILKSNGIVRLITCYPSRKETKIFFRSRK